MDTIRKQFTAEVTWWKSVAIGIFVIVIVKRMMRKFSATSSLSAKGKTVLITGASCGIGKAAATEFAKRDARVILACRDIEKAKDAVFDIRRHTNKGWLIVQQLDLASLGSVTKFASDILASEEKLDVLVNNAGVMGVPFQLTEDGFETTFAVNHLGHFLLTNLLVDLLKKSEPSRVVVVSSRLYKTGKIDFEDLNGQQIYSASKAYSQSKLANILFAKQLSARLRGSGVGVFSLTPGMVKTGLARHYLQGSWLKQVLFETIGKVFLRSPEQGCETILHCALSPGLQNHSGAFFGNCKEVPLSQNAQDEAVAKQLWRVSERLTNFKA